MDTSSGIDTDPSEAWPNAPAPGFLERKVDLFHERMRRWQSDKHILEGLTPGPEAILVNSNDYLDLAYHPVLIQAARDAMWSGGHGVLMSGALLHGDNPHRALEHRLADFLQAETGVLCQSGFTANTGLLQCIADRNIPVHVDILGHMSLWEGIQAARATAIPFRHNDLDDLQQHLVDSGPGVILVDSVYSSNGSVCPLADVADLSTRHGCVLVVDESHSVGTHGPHGEGMVAELGLHEHVHFRTASLSKAFAARAGFVTCTERFLPYFKMASRPAVFSSTLLPSDLAWLEAALPIIRDADDRRERLRRGAAYLREGLSELGYDIANSESQIISLEAGPEPETMRLRDALEKRGIFGSIFCDPATSVNRSLVRLSLHAGLTGGQLQWIAQVCRDIREEVDMAHWRSTQRRASARLH